jgi:hypothetical protein
MFKPPFLRIFFFLLFLLTAILGYAKSDYRWDIHLIADSLKENANAVIRFSDTKFTLKSSDLGIETRIVAISVLNNDGLRNAHFIEYGNQYKTIKKFTADIYDKNGKKIKNYKFSDLTKVKISDDLTTDWYVNYVNIAFPPSPFTIVYTYEIEWKKSIMFLPAFYPLGSFNLSLEKATHTITIPTSMHLLMYKYDPDFLIKTDTISTQNTTYISSLCSKKALTYENYAPNLHKLIPYIQFAPQNFKYENTQGSNESIESIGQWQYNLIKTQTILSEDQQKLVHEITKNFQTDYEKVKALYEYIGNNTRYESIQLGIGGYQPIQASEVLKVGFGDCKGLSILMQSMLEVIGIKSYFTVIKSDTTDKYLTDNFFGFLSCNHAILQVPLNNDTLWLEMTSNLIPFGYVHSNIAGHDAILISEKGGKKVRLPEYAIDHSIDTQNANIIIHPDLNATVQFNRELHVNYYNKFKGLTNQPQNKSVDFVRSNVFFPQATITNLHIENNKNPLPFLRLTYDIHIPSYGINTNSRLFIPINPFRNKNLLSKSKKTRINDFCIEDNTNFIDTYSITIPTDYIIESIPAKINISSKFGILQSDISANGNLIEINQKLQIFEGSWNKAEYEDFLEFIKIVEENYKRDIIIKKN